MVDPPRAVTLIRKLIGVWNIIKFGSNLNEEFKFPYYTLMKFSGSNKFDCDYTNWMFIIGQLVMSVVKL